MNINISVLAVDFGRAVLEQVTSERALDVLKEIADVPANTYNGGASIGSRNEKGFKQCKGTVSKRSKSSFYESFDLNWF